MSIELSCPYTGRTVRVQASHAGDGPTVYYQVGAWSPNRAYPTLRDARVQMLRRGKDWLPDTGQDLTCPYLGAVVTFVPYAAGYRPVGCYDPDKTYTDSEAIYHALGMRDGKPAEGTVPAETPHKLEVKHEGAEVPFEIKKAEEQASRAKTDGLASIKEVATPIVKELFERRK